MPNATHKFDLQMAIWQALPISVLTISVCWLSQGVWAAGPIQPPSCEHPPAPPPQVPYPPNLGLVPVNAPSFPPPGSGTVPTTPGMPVQTPSCVQPPIPPPVVPYPPNLIQTPVNAPSFPTQPVTPYQPTNYGTIPYIGNTAQTVGGLGNSPGIGIPGNILYGLPGTTTLRSPLIPGAGFSFPGVPVMPGALPPIGSGYSPSPVTPGMMGQAPTPVPWTDGTGGNPQAHTTSQAVIPANQIDQQSNTISMPYSNMTAQPPNSWKANIPASPSTPGQDPGMLRQPAFNGSSLGQNSAKLVELGEDGQLSGDAPKERSIQRGKSMDFGLSEKTSPQKQYFAYRMKVSHGPNGETLVNSSDPWQGMAGSTVQDFGTGAKGVMGKNGMAQTAYDSARPAEYPGGQSNTGSLNSNSPGNHGHSAQPSIDGAPLFADAQVTNDLYGTPMVNLSRKYTGGSGIPQTTIAPY